MFHGEGAGDPQGEQEEYDPFEEDDGTIPADWLSLISSPSSQAQSDSAQGDYARIQRHRQTGCFDERTNDDCASFMLNILSNPTLIPEAASHGLQIFPSIFERMKNFAGPIPAWMYLPSKRRSSEDLSWVSGVPALIVEVGAAREGPTTTRSLQFGGKYHVLKNSEPTGRFKIVVKVLKIIASFNN